MPRTFHLTFGAMVPPFYSTDESRKSEHDTISGMMRATTMRVVNGYQYSVMCGQQVARQKGRASPARAPYPQNVM